MTDLHYQSATELAARIRRGELRGRELLEAYIERTAKLNPKLNAVVTLDEARARARADALDAMAKRSEFVGPLHGLPVTIKDSIESAGLLTTGGMPFYRDHVPATNAPALQRLIDAGAVVFGKTNLPPYTADLQSYNPLFGTSNNPWDVTRTPGGSSGGSAAAVAAGMTAFELGSDIGGSIRTPAHFCGIYGHKPTYGVIPSLGHIPGPPGSRAETDIMVLGPMARSAGDLMLLMDVLAGPGEDKAIAWSLDLPPPRRTSLPQYRVAAWLDDGDFPVDSDVREQLESTVAALRKAGVEVNTEARPAFALRNAFEHYLRLMWPITGAALQSDAFRHLVAQADKADPNDPDIEPHMARYMTSRHRDWLRANEARHKYRAAWRDFFRDHDVLLCPVNPICAFPHDHSQPQFDRTILINGHRRWYWEQLVWVGALAGMAYLPATAAPVGLSKRGLPVGMQIIGPYLEDRTTIDFAAKLREVVGGFTVPVRE